MSESHSFKKYPLSLVVITKNEVDNLKRCLESVPFASEVIVLDSGSTDGTIEHAQNLGARVYSQDWLGFGAQKNRAVSYASHDWVLCLDADEALSPGLSIEIQDFFERQAYGLEENQKSAFGMPRKSWYLGRWITHGGWYPDRQVRLFNKKFSRWSDAAIHEKVISENLEFFKSDLEHYVFKSISHQVLTNDKYSSLQATEYVKNGGRFSFYKWTFKPWVKFIECYFLKRGFLDGVPGFVIAVGAAYSVFLRWSKVWELGKK